MTVASPFKTRFVYNPFIPVPLESVTGILLVMKYLPALPAGAGINRYKPTIL